ncbi:MAG: AraC family transcriptional regulator [Victivallales bacterium]
MNEYFNPDIKILIVDCVRLGRFWNIPDLSAPYWRLYWNNAKGASVWFNRKEYPLTPSNMMLIPPDTHFSSVCRGASPTHFYIHFTASPLFDGIAPQVITLSPGEEMIETVVKASRLLSKDKPDSMRISICAMALIFGSLNFMSGKLVAQRKADPRTGMAMKMIEDGLSSPPSNSRIAGKLCMSTNAFLRLFKGNTGVSPQHYSRNKRIDRACILLHYSDLDIKQIASETGFCDRFHFSRVFRRLRGVAPSEFRKRVP